MYILIKGSGSLRLLFQHSFRLIEPTAPGSFTLQGREASKKKHHPWSDSKNKNTLTPDMADMFQKRQPIWSSRHNH